MQDYESDLDRASKRYGVPKEIIAAIIGVETGGCPHTAIREDASINLEAIDRMLEKFPNADVVFIESGGDNLAATFSPELSDLTIYVIDVAAGEKIPRKGGPGITKSDLFVINKTDLAPHVGVDLALLEEDTRRARGPASVSSAHSGSAGGPRWPQPRPMFLFPKIPMRRNPCLIFP